MTERRESGRDGSGRFEGKALAARALELARAGEPEAAWLAAEQLCRLLPHPSAEMLALRAVMAQAAGHHQRAMQDIAAAIALDPQHGAANLAAMRFGDAEEAAAAATRLLDASTPPGILKPAIATLFAQGRTTAVAVGTDRSEIAGFACWRKGTPAPRLSVSFDGEPEKPFRLRADPVHPLAAEDRLAAAISLVWPRGAASARIKGDVPVAGGGLSRPDAAPLRTAPPPDEPPPLPRAVAIVLPVFGDPEATRACLELLLKRQPVPASRIIAVDDATPHQEIAALVDRLADEGNLALMRNAANVGFAASVNRALDVVSDDEDVLLLNADAFLPPAALSRLQQAAYAAPDIGTVTPLSNNGEYTSVPVRFRDNPLPAPEEMLALDEAAARANPGLAVTLPNGIGFCLYLRRDALAAAGRLSLAFGRGYYEDVDLCLRMARLGFRSIAAADVYVGHAGAASFGAARRGLVMRNKGRLVARHPEYDSASARFLREDPLAEAAAQFEAVGMATAPPFRLVLAPQLQIDRGAAMASEASTRLAAVRCDDGGIWLAFMEGAGASHALSLRYAVGGTDALVADIAGLPVERLVLVDPHLLPQEVVAAAELSGLPTELDFASAGAVCARSGLVVARGRATCCSGWCPLELAGLARHDATAPPLRRLADRAVSVSAATPALARMLLGFFPGIRCFSEKPLAPQAAAMDPMRRRRPPRLVIVGIERAEPLLITATVAALGKAAADIEIVLLSGGADDVPKRQPGLLHLGRVRPEECTGLAAALQPDLLFVADRLGVEGSPEGEALAAMGIPTARFIWGAPVSGPKGADLVLRPDASAGDAARRIAGWAALRRSMGRAEELVDREQRAIVQPETRSLDLGGGRLEVQSEA